MFVGLLKSVQPVNFTSYLSNNIMCNNVFFFSLVLFYFVLFCCCFFFLQILMSVLKESITVVLTLFVAIPKDPTTVLVEPDITEMERIAAN